MKFGTNIKDRLIHTWASQNTIGSGDFSSALFPSLASSTIRTFGCKEPDLSPSFRFDWFWLHVPLREERRAALTFEDVLYLTMKLLDGMPKGDVFGVDALIWDKMNLVGRTGKSHELGLAHAGGLVVGKESLNVLRSTGNLNLVFHLNIKVLILLLTYFDRVLFPSLCIYEVNCDTKVGGERTTPDIRYCCNTTGRAVARVSVIQ